MERIGSLTAAAGIEWAGDGGMPTNNRPTFKTMYGKVTDHPKTPRIFRQMIYAPFLN
jgi:hypothetical protein